MFIIVSIFGRDLYEQQIGNEAIDFSLKSSDHADATEELMSLSPYEMRNLLHHIMAGEEFDISVQHSVSHSFYSVISEQKATVSKVEILSLVFNFEF